MKRIVICFLVILILAQSLFGCNATKSADIDSNSEHTEYANEEDHNQEETVSSDSDTTKQEFLVEEWDHKLFKKMRNVNLTKIDPFLELLANVIMQKDANSLMNLYAPNLVDNGFVSTDELFSFFEGSVISVNRLAVAESESKDGEHHNLTMRISCDIETTVRTYRMAVKLCNIDSVDVNNVGICSLYIIDAENTDMQFAYWGNSEWYPGIVIDTEPYFPPPLPTETTTENDV